MPRRPARMVSALLALAVAAALPATAHAALGDLAFAGCLSNGGMNGCTDISPGFAPVDEPADVKLTPNGAGYNVYVSSFGSNSLSHFVRHADGSLAFAGCLATAGGHGCADPSPGQTPISNPGRLAIDRSGKSLYLTSDAAVSHFTLMADGSLSFSGCIADGAAHGCTDPDPDPGNEPLTFPDDVVVSPKGDTVYVLSFYSDSISVFTRASDGSLTFAGCIADAGIEGCTDPSPGQHPMYGPKGVAVSPDGTSVYVVAGGHAAAPGVPVNSLAHFTRGLDGSLEFAGCVADGGANGCTDPSPGHAPLEKPEDVAVSGDGASVYVDSTVSNAISHFTRAGDGSIGFAGCIADGGAEGCANPSLGNAPLARPEGIAVSPDRRSVYVASRNSHAISHLTRAPNGSLAFAGCVANGGANGCRDALPGQIPITAPTALAVSPDSADVYLVAGLSDSMARFRREQFQFPSPATVSLPASPPSLQAGGHKKRCKHSKKGGKALPAKKKCKRKH